MAMLDNDLIPKDYPEVSSSAVDRTTVGPLSFSELQARLTVVSAPSGWRVDPDRKMVYINDSIDIVSI